MRVIAFAPPAHVGRRGAGRWRRSRRRSTATATGPEAEYWRELRADVRSLSEPMDPAFADALRQRVGAPRQPSPVAARARRAVARIGAGVRTRVRGVARGRPGGGLRRRLDAPSNSPQPHELARPRRARASANVEGAGPRTAVEASGSRRRSEAPHGPSVGKAAARRRVADGAPLRRLAAGRRRTPGEAGGRLQHLGASISLGGGGEGVQRVADRVGRATVAAGGFVESSRVQTQQGSAGEALLTLVLPSAKLAVDALPARTDRARAGRDAVAAGHHGRIRRRRRAPGGSPGRTGGAAAGARQRRALPRRSKASTRVSPERPTRSRRPNTSRRASPARPARRRSK